MNLKPRGIHSKPQARQKIVDLRLVLHRIGPSVGIDLWSLQQTIGCHHLCSMRGKGFSPVLADIFEQHVNELLLDQPEGSEGPSEDDLEAGRRWLSAQAAEPISEPAAAQQVEAAKPTGGTLFERMSIIARGAAKTPGADEDKDSPLDIPRFLNRQNNQ